MTVSGKLYKWIRGHTKCSPKVGRKNKPVLADAGTPNIYHIYEEIPDVIPADWRDASNDSIPSFSLVGTSGAGVEPFTVSRGKNAAAVKSSMKDDLNVKFGVTLEDGHRMKVLSDNYSYEIPQQSTRHRRNSNNDHKRQTIFLNSQSKCTMDTAGCVPDDCDYLHSSADTDELYYSIGFQDDPTKTSDHKTDAFYASEHYYNVLEPNWEKLCDEIFAELIHKKTDTGRKLPNVRKAMGVQNGVGSLYQGKPCRNKLLRDLTLRNHDRQMTAHL